MNIRGSWKTWGVGVNSDYVTKSRNAYGQTVAFPYYSLSFALDEQVHLVSLQTIYFQGLTQPLPTSDLSTEQSYSLSVPGCNSRNSERVCSEGTVGISLIP